MSLNENIEITKMITMNLEEDMNASIHYIYSIHFMAANSIVVVIFQSGWKWWIVHLTDDAVSRTKLLMMLKIYINLNMVIIGVSLNS